MCQFVVLAVNIATLVVIKMFAESIGRNAVHGSDSDENAEIEANFHFGTEVVTA